MNRKIWVINEPEWDEDTLIAAATRGDKKVPGSALKEPQKDPALAFSLSFMLWGSGHFYARQPRNGSFFLLAMVLLYSAGGSLLFFREAAARWVLAWSLPEAFILAGIAIVIGGGLAALFGCATRTYFQTLALRTQPFRGVNNAAWPSICSILFPGWGQFLNGQPWKGLILGSFAVVGFSSLATLVIFWQFRTFFLQETVYRGLLEMTLLVALAGVLTGALTWMASLHDAVCTCRNPSRKRSIPKRVADFFRGLKSKRIRALMPEIRGAVLLGLLFVAMLMAGERFIPWDDYRASIEEVRVVMLDAQLHIIPDLLRDIRRHLPS